MLVVAGFLADFCCRQMVFYVFNIAKVTNIIGMALIMHMEPQPNWMTVCLSWAFFN